MRLKLYRNTSCLFDSHYTGHDHIFGTTTGLPFIFTSQRERVNDIYRAVSRHAEACVSLHASLCKDVDTLSPA